MKNGNLPASPLTGNAYEILEARIETGHSAYDAHCLGLTKREHLAAMAMQGLSHATAPDGTWFHDPSVVAAAAAEYADALLAELEKQNEA